MAHITTIGKPYYFSTAYFEAILKHCEQQNLNLKLFSNTDYTLCTPVTYCIPHNFLPTMKKKLTLSDQIHPVSNEHGDKISYPPQEGRYMLSCSMHKLFGLYASFMYSFPVNQQRTANTSFKWVHQMRIFLSTLHLKT